jgi:amphi-Trp domain-containing protein
LPEWSFWRLSKSATLSLPESRKFLQREVILGQKGDVTMAHEVKDIEVKEKMSPDQFKQMLRQWVEALDNNQEFTVSLKGHEYTVPGGAINHAKLEVEYEIDKGEYELEFTMKWH